MVQVRKIASWAYLLAVGLVGALLIELLTENGIDHLAGVRGGTEQPGAFAYLNDRLYIPAALISIAVISRFVERIAPHSILTALLVVSALVMLFGHVL